MTTLAIRRVPIDFDAPLESAWEGYDNPYNYGSEPCPHCLESGKSPIYLALEEIWYGRAFQPRYDVEYKKWLSMLEKDHRYEVEDFFEHIARQRKAAGESKGSKGWEHFLDDNEEKILRDMGILHELHRESPLGKNKTIPLILINNKIDEWGFATSCKHCMGELVLIEDMDAFRKHMGWEFDSVEAIISGNGYQVWSDEYNGPITPVFATPDELADYMIDKIMTLSRHRDPDIKNNLVYLIELSDVTFPHPVYFPFLIEEAYMKKGGYLEVIRLAKAIRNQ